MKHVMKHVATLSIEADWWNRPWARTLPTRPHPATASCSIGGSEVLRWISWCAPDGVLSPSKSRVRQQEEQYPVLPLSLRRSNRNAHYWSEATALHWMTSSYSRYRIGYGHERADRITARTCHRRLPPRRAGTPRQGVTDRAEEPGRGEGEDPAHLQPASDLQDGHPEPVRFQRAAGDLRRQRRTRGNLDRRLGPLSAVAHHRRAGPGAGGGPSTNRPGLIWIVSGAPHRVLDCSRDIVVNPHWWRQSWTYDGIERERKQDRHIVEARVPVANLASFIVATR